MKMFILFDTQGIRALTIDKDNAPKVCSLLNGFLITLDCFCKIIHGLFFLPLYALNKMGNLLQWDPPTLDKVDDEKVELVFQPFADDLELSIPEKEECRLEWHASSNLTVSKS